MYLESQVKGRDPSMAETLAKDLQAAIDVSKATRDEARSNREAHLARLRVAEQSMGLRPQGRGMAAPNHLPFDLTDGQRRALEGLGQQTISPRTSSRK